MLFTVLAGCRSVKPSTETIHTVKDSSWTEVKYHKKDTTITIPGAVSFITLPFSELTDIPVKKTIGHSTVSLKRSGDNIEAVCECVAYKQRITYLEKETTMLRQLLDLQKQLTTKPYPYVPWYIKMLAWMGGICLGYFAFGIAKKLILK